MDPNFPFTAEDESPITVESGHATTSKYFYSEEKGSKWVTEKFPAVYNFKENGSIHKQFRVGKRFILEILGWTNPQKVGKRSIRVLKLFGFDKVPYIITFSSTEEMDKVYKEINDVINLQNEKLNILIDTKIIFFSPNEKDGVPGTLNVTRNGAIFATPSNALYGSLLINMRASVDADPRADPTDEKAILINSINEEKKTGYEVKIKVENSRDEILKKMQDLISKLNLRTPFTVANPVKAETSPDKKEEEEEDADEKETFKEFPSIVLKEAIDGEENDDILVNAQTKIYTINNKSWECFDAGEFHINYMKSTKEYRIVMRTGNTKMICLNMKLFKGMNLSLKADKMLSFLGFFKQSSTPEPLLINFKDSADCLTSHLYMETALAEME